MKLRKYELSGPATYTETEVVWFSIQETKDTDGVVSKFLHWQVEENIFPMRTGGGVTGGGMAHQGFSPEDAPRVRQWLKENNVQKKKEDG